MPGKPELLGNYWLICNLDEQCCRCSQCDMAQVQIPDNHWNTWREGICDWSATFLLQYHIEVFNIIHDNSWNWSRHNECTRYAVCVHPVRVNRTWQRIVHLLEIDNSGSVDIANSWSDGSCTYHVDVVIIFYAI